MYSTLHSSVEISPHRLDIVFFLDCKLGWIPRKESEEICLCLKYMAILYLNIIYLILNHLNRAFILILTLILTPNRTTSKTEIKKDGDFAIKKS